MSELARILDQLHRAFDNDAWHGPSVGAVLQGVDARVAAARPIPGAHSIWEIVLHVRVWKNEVRRRIEGQPARTLPPELDWPIVENTSAEAWRRALADLREEHERLREAIGRLNDAHLDRPLAGDRDTMWTYYTTLHGIIQHDLYHAGQIAMLKKPS